MGQRLVLAATIIALLFGLINTPQTPASAAGPVAFEHVFSDGDPFNNALYSIPDLTYPCDGTPFVFRQGAYVLLISASEVAGMGAPNVPTVTGKGVSWSQVATHVFDPVTVGNFTTRMRITVFQAFATNPDTNPETSKLTFDFGTQTQVRHSRSVFQSAANNVEGANPVVQTVWTSGVGTTAQASLSGFGNADNATVFGVAKHSQGPIGPNGPLQELGDTVTGPTPCEDAGEPHRLGTSWAAGQLSNPSASWTGSVPWSSVALEVTSTSGGTPTTTTQPSTTTTEATTTTRPTTTTTESTTTSTLPDPTTSTTQPPQGTTTTTAAAEPPPTTSTTIPSTPPTTVETSEPPPDSFVDDDGSVFEQDIESLASGGIALGCNPPVNDRFCPDDPLTRGQMAAFMARALGLTGDPTDRFVDDDDSVFEDDIEAIAQAGITLGCNPPANDRFCPDDTLTRGQMAAFMARALGLTGDPTDRFFDDDDSLFETDIEAIAEAGITLGCNPPTNDRFCPTDTLTRGQMAAFLNRMLQYAG